MRPRILFLVPADYDALRRKGVDRMILERDEDGFFERVVTVHPLAMHDRTIDLTPVHRVREFSAGRCVEPASVGGMVALPFRLMSIARRLLRIVREERIDVIRANDAYLMGLLGWVVARRCGIPFCVSIHAAYDAVFALTPKSGLRRLRRRVASLLPRFVMRRADLVLPIRHHLATIAIAGGAPPARVRVIPHGVDLRPFTGAGRFDIRRELGIAPDVAIISFVGRLSGENYVDDLLAVAGRLAACRQNFVLVIAGGGDLASRVDEWMDRSAHARSRVRVVGFWPHDKALALRRASLVALVFMGGFSLIEACAAGCVPIAYDVEWHHELVIDGVTGMLVPEGDIDAAVAAVERLLDDRAFAERIGRAARQTAFERHDIRRTSQLKRDAYQWLIDGAGALA